LKKKRKTIGYELYIFSKTFTRTIQKNKKNLNKQVMPVSS